jgi:hypothetical protein
MSRDRQAPAAHGPDLVGDRLQIGQLAAGNCQVSACIGKGERDRLADTSAGSGYQRGLSLERKE